MLIIPLYAPGAERRQNLILRVIHYGPFFYGITATDSNSLLSPSPRIILPPNTRAMLGEKNVTIRRTAFYFALVLLLKVFVEAHHFPTLVYLVLSLPFIIPELLGEYRPDYLAWVFVNRKIIVCGVMLFFICLAAVSYSKYPYPAAITHSLDANKSLLREILVGLGLGMITRMLLTHLSYQLIRDKDDFGSKILILLAYMAFLIMLPLNYRYYLCPFFFACGIGFFVHYLTRHSERKNAGHSKLQRNIIQKMSTLTMANSYRLTSIEEQAIRDYAHRRWIRLRKLLTMNPETEILFFIKLCTLTRLQEYDSALALLSDKESEHPAWYEANEHFFQLHRALNKFRKTGNNEHLRDVDEISADFLSAIKGDKHCLVSNALLALKQANDIDQGATDSKTIALNIEKGAIARRHIDQALKNYEQRERSVHPVSLLTGMAIPVTYSFLLDIYGYVLLKNDMVKLAKIQFIQCLYQDPSFSSTYLHLAEWYVRYYKNEKHSEKWKKAVKLNLYIAIFNERLYTRNGNESIIAEKARKILESL